ncbi:MAG: DUF4097 family beta strand repeat-containing protein [Acidimicrobiia bacterium]
MSVQSFSVGERPRVTIRLASGSVRVIGGNPGTIVVDLQGRGADTAIVEQSGDTVAVRQEERVWRGSVHVTVTAPEGVNVSASLASADLDIEVPTEDLTASLASGDARIAEIRRELSFKSASGDLELERLVGKGKVNSASGDVRIGLAHEDLSVNTASGDISIGEAGGDLRLNSASGDVGVRNYLGTNIALVTISGDVVVGLPTGRSVDVELRSLSGRIKLPSPSGVEGDRVKVQLRFKSVSGDFELVTTGS